MRINVILAVLIAMFAWRVDGEPTTRPSANDPAVLYQEVSERAQRQFDQTVAAARGGRDEQIARADAGRERRVQDAASVFQAVYDRALRELLAVRKNAATAAVGEFDDRIRYLTRAGRLDDAAALKTVKDRFLESITAEAATAASTRPAWTFKRLLIEARIDGSDELHLTRDGFRWQHKHWAWPSDVRINGRPWDPQAQALLPLDAQGIGLTAADLRAERVTVVDRVGRDTVAVEAVADELVIYFSDGLEGADRYAVTLEFAGERPNPPVANPTTKVAPSQGGDGGARSQ